MTLPNFLIIGAQKAGTTWLARMLSQHPDVYVARKEMHFFDKEFNHRRGIGWYERQFEEVCGQSAIGEKTPDYLWAGGKGAEGHLPDVHHNIRRALPDVKFMVVLRDPVRRAVSALNHLVYTRRVSPLHRMDELLVGSKRELVREHGVLEKGLYHRQLSAYGELFPPERFLHLVFEEDVRRDPWGGLRKACFFLGVDPEFRFEGVRRRVNAPRRSRAGLALSFHAPRLSWLASRLDASLPPWKAQVRPETLARLASYYASENWRLVELLGRLPEGWTQPDRGSRPCCTSFAPGTPTADPGQSSDAPVRPS